MLLDPSATFNAATLTLNTLSQSMESMPAGGEAAATMRRKMTRQRSSMRLLLGDFDCQHSTHSRRSNLSISFRLPKDDNKEKEEEQSPN